MSVFKCPKCGATLTVEALGTPMTLEHVKNLFSQDLQDSLTFTVKDGEVIIKPRQYLGSENFAKVAQIIRGAGGKYISAGKESHFRVGQAELNRGKV